jgi:hypothetical protein
MRRAVGVTRKLRHKLAAEPGRRGVRGHRAEKPLPRHRRDPRRHRRRAGGKLLVRPGERPHQRIEIEQVLHIRSREDEHVLQTLQTNDYSLV